MDSVTREQVLAFRLRSHHLATRLPTGDAALATSACGIQDSPPGSAALSLHARLANLRPADLEQALLQDKTLVQTWAMRAAPHVVPTLDLAVFTAGLMTDDDEALLYYIRGASGHLQRLGFTAAEVVGRAGAALTTALAGQRLTKDTLGHAMARLMEEGLTAAQLAIWRSPDGLRDNTHGESLARFALSILALQGRLLLVPDRGRAVTIVLAEEWLGQPLPEANRQEAAKELLRLYLHCYGPSRPAQFALWAGISPAQARRAWSLVAEELQSMERGRPSTWMLEADVVALREALLPQGVRLLPPHDPYLQARDRDLLVAERDRQRLVWRTIGNPGAILVDGEIAGVWRPAKRGKALRISARLFRSLEPGTRSRLQDEAERLGPFRGADTVELLFES